MTKPNSKTPKGQPRVGIRAPWAIELSEQAVDYLRVPTMKGFNRLDAYCHLLNNCVMEPTEYKLPYGSTISLNVGEVVVSITDLAEKWDWARETVRKFLDRLESFGLLVKRQLDRCSVISLRIVYVDPALQEKINGIELPPQIAEQIDTWLKGEITDDDIAKFFNLYFRYDLSEDSENKHMEHSNTMGTILLWLKRVAEHVAGDTFIYPAPLWYSMYRMVSEIHAEYFQDNWFKWTELARKLLDQGERIWPCLVNRNGKMLLMHLAYNLGCSLDAKRRLDANLMAELCSHLSDLHISSGDDATAAVPGFPYRGL